MDRVRIQAEGGLPQRPHLPQESIRSQAVKLQSQPQLPETQPQRTGSGPPRWLLVPFFSPSPTQPPPFPSLALGLCFCCKPAQPQFLPGSLVCRMGIITVRCVVGIREAGGAAHEEDSRYRPVAIVPTVTGMMPWKILVTS